MSYNLFLIIGGIFFIISLILIKKFIPETKEYLEIMKSERIRLKTKKSKTNIPTYRALQFQITNDIPYSCSAGESLLTVMGNGDLLKDLRTERIPDDCKKCEHASFCKGGLKCLTYAIKKDYNLKDVGCNL